MVLFATKLAGNAVNLEESRIKKWKEVASLVTSFETLDPAIPKATTTTTTTKGILQGGTLRLKEVTRMIQGHATRGSRCWN